MLSVSMTLGETIDALPDTQPQSRYWFRSPCYFVRALDLWTHIIVPEALENFTPRLARYLRSTSPRWGRSWRHW